MRHRGLGRAHARPDGRRGLAARELAQPRGQCPGIALRDDLGSPIAHAGPRRSFQLPGPADDHPDRVGRDRRPLPIDFPVFPGSHEATGDPTEGPISGAFSAPSDGITVTKWYQGALEQAGYRTEAVSGPFEDGSTVIDSVGATTCRVQTTIRPLSGTTLVSVRYGAGCLD